MSRVCFRRGLLLLLLLGLGGRLLRYLLVFPIWGDEAFLCLNLLDRSFLDLLDPLRFDQVAPALFLWIEALFLRWLGPSEVSLRLPSLLAGCAALLVFSRLARLCQSRRAALLATGILAVSYYPLRHACEIKPYGFDVLASVLLTTLGMDCLRNPGRVRPLGLLCLCVPICLFASYPAAFTAGGVVLALVAIRRPQAHQAHLAIVLLVLLGSLVAVFLLTGRLQHAGMNSSAGGYWDSTFPPGEPLALLRWLITTHTGNLFAYPLGGKNGGSSLTFLCCLLGARVLWRTGRRPLLILLTAPFLLTFLAAALRLYPYGGSARVGQHLAPPICLLAGLGLSSLLRSRGTMFALGLLALLGIVGLVRDVQRPFKTPGDEQARQLVRSLAEELGRDDVLVVWAAPARLYPSLEWYLRLLGERVVWIDDPAEMTKSSGACRLICLRFVTNSCPEPEVIRELSGPGATFSLVGAEYVPLSLGPETDATRGCAVWRYQRSTSQVSP